MSSPALANTNAAALVVPPKQDVAAALKDIRPPVQVADPMFWAMLALGLLLVALLARWIWKKWFKNRAVELASAPLIPPHIRARERLSAARRLINDPQPFCNEVANTIRAYLDERFDLHANDRTTEEFLAEMQHSPALKHHQKATLAEFLMLCDLAKFARHEPTLTELERLHLVASQLVDETEPSAPDKEAPTQP